MNFDKTPLNEFVTLQRGFDLPKDDRIEGNVPVVASTGIGGYHHEAKVSAPGVVIGRSGSIGGGQYIEQDFWPLNTTLWVKDFKGHDPRYVYYLMRSIDFSTFNVGSGVPTLNRNHLSSLLVNEQGHESEQRIAKYLGDIDDKIAVNTKTNQTLEEMAQAIFKSWFVDCDPVKAKMNGEQPEGMDEATASLFPEKLVESELGLIPEGWQVSALSSVVDVIMGQSPKGSTYNDQNEGTPLVNGPVEFGVYHPVAQKWTTAPTKMSKDKDLIVCVRGSTTGRYVVSDGEYCLGRGVCSIRSDDFPSFANYLFKSELNSLLHLTTGSTFPSWSGPILKNYKVVAPPETIIEKFELLIGELCEMMARNTGQNETLSTLRDTLLPKLLSGEIELGKADITPGDLL